MPHPLHCKNIIHFPCTSLSSSPLLPPPSSVPPPFGTSDAQKKLIDAFLMRILGHKLNAIYCGKWQMRKAERWRGRGIGLNLGQAAAAAVVVAFEK